MFNRKINLKGVNQSNWSNRKKGKFRQEEEFKEKEGINHSSDREAIAETIVLLAIKALPLVQGENLINLHHQGNKSILCIRRKKRVHQK